MYFSKINLLGAMNRFYDNLMNQNKKRPLDTTSTNGDVQTNGETNSVDTSPLSKRKSIIHFF